jgi:hypothetical protein
MVKINTEAFEQVSKNANLSHESNDVTTATEVVKNTPVYNIPRTWIDQLKKNKMSVSGYLKQALYEKMKRDEML